MTQDLNECIEQKRNGTIAIVKMNLAKIRHIKLTKMTKQKPEENEPKTNRTKKKNEKLVAKIYWNSHKMSIISAVTDRREHNLLLRFVGLCSFFFLSVFPSSRLLRNMDSVDTAHLVYFFKNGRSKWPLQFSFIAEIYFTLNVALFVALKNPIWENVVNFIVDNI